MKRWRLILAIPLILATVSGVEGPQQAVSQAALAQPVSTSTEEVRARADALFARAATTTRYSEAAVDLLTLSLGIYRQLGDKRAEAFTLLYLGMNAARASAVEPLEAALAIQRSLDDWLGEYLALNELSSVNEAIGAQSTARALRDQIFALFQRVGPHRADAAIYVARSVTYAFSDEAERRE